LLKWVVLFRSGLPDLYLIRPPLRMLSRRGQMCLHRQLQCLRLHLLPAAVVVTHSRAHPPSPLKLISLYHHFNHRRSCGNVVFWTNSLRPNHPWRQSLLPKAFVLLALAGCLCGFVTSLLCPHPQSLSLLHLPFPESSSMYSTLSGHP
jgi:hypothetical protein